MLFMCLSLASTYYILILGKKLHCTFKRQKNFFIHKSMFFFALAKYDTSISNTFIELKDCVCIYLKWHLTDKRLSASIGVFYPVS